MAVLLPPLRRCTPRARPVRRDDSNLHMLSSTCSRVSSPHAMTPPSPIPPLTPRSTRLHSRCVTTSPTPAPDSTPHPRPTILNLRHPSRYPPPATLPRPRPRLWMDLLPALVPPSHHPRLNSTTLTQCSRRPPLPLRQQRQPQPPHAAPPSDATSRPVSLHQRVFTFATMWRTLHRLALAADLSWPPISQMSCHTFSALGLRYRGWTAVPPCYIPQLSMPFSAAFLPCYPAMSASFPAESLHH